MINTPFVQRYQTYPLQMDALECVKTSPPLPRCLLDIVEKVIRVVLVPFALIIDFFINLARSAANVCISLVNWVYGPLPNAPPIPVRRGENGTLEIVPTPAVEESELLQSSVAEMPAPIVILFDVETPQKAQENIVAAGPPSQVMQEPVMEAQVPASAPQLTTVVGPPAISANPLVTQTAVSSSATTISQTSTAPTSSSLASSTTRNAAVPAPPTLARLPCTEIQVGQIHELLMILATNSKFDILWKQQKPLTVLGGAIREVHPLKFLSIACSTEQGRGHLAAIFSDMFKRGSFMSYSNSTTPSFTCKLDAEAKKNNLEPYLKELAEKTNNLAVIQKDVKDKKWDDLVKHLAGIRVT